jgi:hypothetical protein
MSYPGGNVPGMVTVEQVRAVALALPRTTEHLIHDRVKFRVGKIVYVAFSRDETVMGFGFPKEERQSLVDARPEVFHLPNESDMRFRWVQAWMAALDPLEMEELVIDAWRMVVPKRVAAAYVAGLPDRQ